MNINGKTKDRIAHKVIPCRKDPALEPGYLNDIERAATIKALPIVTAKPGRIHILWPDGSEDELQNRDVRGSCQCAQCVEEFSGEQMLDVNSIAPDIDAVSVDPLGNYAVSIAWNDGHSSGIFTWDHLRGLAGKAAV
ncbi:MAG: DUF971 domain-containing protein [Candidatus Hydrogenedentes bacterium]|nr:DUF971 domain-containing protein [Candidatus Hydrogenedentota bacterium]